MSQKPSQDKTKTNSSDNKDLFYPSQMVPYSMFFEDLPDSAGIDESLLEEYAIVDSQSAITDEDQDFEMVTENEEHQNETNKRAYGTTTNLHHDRKTPSDAH